MKSFLSNSMVWWIKDKFSYIVIKLWFDDAYKMHKAFVNSVLISTNDFWRGIYSREYYNWFCS